MMQCVIAVNRSSMEARAKLWEREALGDGGLTCGTVETDDTVVVRFRPAVLDAKPAKPGVVSRVFGHKRTRTARHVVVLCFHVVLQNKYKPAFTMEDLVLIVASTRNDRLGSTVACCLRSDHEQVFLAPVCCRRNPFRVTGSVGINKMNSRGRTRCFGVSSVSKPRSCQLRIRASLESHPSQPPSTFASPKHYG